MKRLLFTLLGAGLILLAGQSFTETQKKTIVVTYTVLGSLVKELAGNSFVVKTSIPNGLDVHDWEPSAKDIETITKADLIIQNGLDLEGGMQKALKQASDAGVKFFTASDYITVRQVGQGEGIPGDDPDQALGAADPHIWLDPVNMKSVIIALAKYIKDNYSIDLSKNASKLTAKLDSLDDSIKKKVSSISPGKRKLVTGHESMGYFAQRYGFKLVGTIIPSLSTEGDVSASDMAALKKLIAENNVSVIFVELGTPGKVTKNLANEAHVKSVPLITHYLLPDLNYFTFMNTMVDDITQNLK